MDERREYFRIDVEARIDLAITQDSARQQDPASYFSQSGVLHTLAELKKLDGEGLQVQQQIKDNDRALGEYLHLLSRKVDILALYCLSSSAESLGDTQTVTISEGGLDFTYPQQVDAGSPVALMLVFTQPPMAIALHARAVRCEPDPTTGFTIAAEFHYQNSAQRQQISQQIMRAQMESIRSSKS
ncbi:PilZ domain-containing protein [Gilvimarinus sp. DA14]|uniref:PilZ domain-containing protein n=1 Tax=Gilvimarinus sp. DA14 TaxID=2956798 RepID=UPI0020B6B43A|nr:PilZ domain-containing protein [Gilvimarinus sp. DA14]UTF60924.1 PilZ domain-containing protein [Gilvimarinus sp. DA14]